MKISTKGRYALRVLIDLAEQQNDNFIPLKEIAARQEISEKYLENILKVLVHNNVLTGMRGKGGGYRLTKSAEELSVGSILRLTEGDLAPVTCLEHEAALCSRAENCRTLPMWKNLNVLVNRFFDNITLADLMEGLE
ncbi:MAG: RrF2 family transcriptional regulator [Saccharofermentanales bacterium]|jgi:Rrf2 family iron-sulfur cluster assembly transcriptional regulator